MTKPENIGEGRAETEETGSENSGQKPMIIRAAFATVVIFLLLLSPAWVLGTIGIFQQHYLISFGILAIGLFLLLWICSGTVYLDDDHLTYSHFLFLRRSVELNSVSAVNVVIKPAPLLVLHGKHSKFRFAIKPFSKEGVTLMLHHIRRHAPNAKFDEASSDLERGDFASVTRETLRVQNLFRLFGTILITGIASSLAAAKSHSAALTVEIILGVALVYAIIVFLRVLSK